MPRTFNPGYLNAKTDKASDEQYTPEYAIIPLLKYLKKDTVIWCPFDTKDSKYVEIFMKEGYKIIYSHIDNGQNFFDYEPLEHYDVIISNPPFSIKDAVIERLYELNKPFAILLPIPALQGQKRFKYFQQGLQLLSFNKRIHFYTNLKSKEIMKGTPFGCAYFCKDFLPQDLILEELFDN